MQPWDTLLLIVIVLGAATWLGALFESFRQSAILGYLLAGAVLGPGGLAVVPGQEAGGILADLGVSLLLFTIGLEFSLSRLRLLGWFAVIGGTLQILVTAGLFCGVAMAAGLPFRPALAIGLLVAPSSTACVLQILRDRTELDSVHGRGATGILLLQDLALVPLVLAMTALGKQGSPGHVLHDLLSSVGYFGLLAILLYLITAYILPRFLHSAAVRRNREILILAAAVIALGTTWLAHVFHVSPALGTFLAGLMLAGSPFAAQLRADVGVLRTLFVTVFFASVGMMADLRWIGGHAFLVAGVVASILFGKTLVMTPLARAFGFSWGTAVATALCIAQIGEFSFVLGALARQNDVLNEHLFLLLVSSALITLFLTPWLVRTSPWLRRSCSIFLNWLKA